MDLLQVKLALKELLTKDISDTIKELKALLLESSPRYSELALIEGRYKELDSQDKLGNISHDNLQLALNKLRFALVSVIDKIDEEDVPHEEQEPGSIWIKIPDVMHLNKVTRCTIKISKDKELLENLVKKESELQAIRVSEVMQVELLNASGEEAFHIISISQMEQFIDEGMVTSWMFNVKPLLEGVFTLIPKVATIEPAHKKNRQEEGAIEVAYSVRVVTGPAAKS